MEPLPFYSPLRLRREVDGKSSPGGGFPAIRDWRTRRGSVSVTSNYPTGSKLRERGCVAGVRFCILLNPCSLVLFLLSIQIPDLVILTDDYFTFFPIPEYPTKTNLISRFSQLNHTKLNVMYVVVPLHLAREHLYLYHRRG
jgi:hypothetical protein